MAIKFGYSKIQVLLQFQFGPFRFFINHKNEHFWRQIFLSPPLFNIYKTAMMYISWTILHFLCEFAEDHIAQPQQKFLVGVKLGAFANYQQFFSIKIAMHCNAFIFVMLLIICKKSINLPNKIMNFRNIPNPSGMNVFQYDNYCRAVWETTWKRP